MSDLSDVGGGRDQTVIERATRPFYAILESQDSAARATTPLAALDTGRRRYRLCSTLNGRAPIDLSHLGRVAGTAVGNPKESPSLGNARVLTRALSVVVHRQQGVKMPDRLRRLRSTKHTARRVHLAPRAAADRWT
ncbi:MAG TPA: hypothetical protein VGG64_21990 [Pirellulales bacterium]